MNETVNSTIASNSLRDTWLLALYLVTAIIAVLGNLFVCVTIYRKKRLNSTTYILIFNVAVSDVLGGVVIPAQWLACSTWSLDSGLLGTTSCGLLKQLQILSYYVSSLTMAAIAYDRYKLVCRPMAPRVKVVWLWVSVWGLGLAFISLMSVINRVSEYFSPTKGLITCRVIWKTTFPVNYTFRLSRFYVHMLTQYVVPLLLTTIFYSLVIHRIWIRKQMTGAKYDTTRRQQFDEKKKRTIKMLIIVTLLFGLAYLPVQVFHFLMFALKVIPLQTDTCYSSTLYVLSYWLGISSCAVNPFLYVYFQVEFQREAARYWKVIRNCGKETTAEVEESGLGASSVAETVTEKGNAGQLEALTLPQTDTV